MGRRFLREHRIEPEKGCLTLLTGNFVHVAHMTQRVSKLGELVELANKGLLVDKPPFKDRPLRLPGYHILQIPKIGEFEPPVEISVSVGIERRVLPCPCLDRLGYPLRHVWWEPLKIVVQPKPNDLT